MNKLWIVIVLAIILVPTGFLIKGYLIHPAYGDDFVYIKPLKLNIHFGSKITDCMSVPIDERAVSDLLNSKEFIVLFDPDGITGTLPNGTTYIDDIESRKYAIATYELQRVLVPLGHKSYSAYTKSYQNESESVRTLGEGNSLLPIVLYEIGDSTSVSRIAPGQIIVKGINGDEINHASCRIDLEILEKVYGVKLPKAQ